SASLWQRSFAQSGAVGRYALDPSCIIADHKAIGPALRIHCRGRQNIERHGTKARHRVDLSISRHSADWLGRIYYDSDRLCDGLLALLALAIHARSDSRANQFVLPDRSGFVLKSRNAIKGHDVHLCCSDSWGRRHVALEQNSDFAQESILLLRFCQFVCAPEFSAHVAQLQSARICHWFFLQL